MMKPPKRARREIQEPVKVEEDDQEDDSTNERDHGIPSPEPTEKVTNHQMKEQPKVMDPQDASRIRKENHKEVERRRREAIAVSIERIGELVPGTQNLNKTDVLHVAVAYIESMQALLREKEQRIEQLEEEMGALHMKIAIDDAMRQSLSNQLH